MQWQRELTSFLASKRPILAYLCTMLKLNLFSTSSIIGISCPNLFSIMAAALEVYSGQRNKNGTQKFEIMRWSTPTNTSITSPWTLCGYVLANGGRTLANPLTLVFVQLSVREIIFDDHNFGNPTSAFHLWHYRVFFSLNPIPYAFCRKFLILSSKQLTFFAQFSE